MSLAWDDPGTQPGAKRVSGLGQSRESHGSEALIDGTQQANRTGYRVPECSTRRGWYSILSIVKPALRTTPVISVRDKGID